MHVYTYILITSTGRYYTGISKDVSKRFIQHCRSNAIFFQKNRPLKIVYTKKFNSYLEARNLEKYVKNVGARKFLQVSLYCEGKHEKNI